MTFPYRKLFQWKNQPLNLHYQINYTLEHRVWNNPVFLMQVLTVEPMWLHTCDIPASTSCICIFLNIISKKVFIQPNVFICVFKEKTSPQDQINRHLTRPPPDYKDQRRNSSSLQPATQYSGKSSSKLIQITTVKKEKQIHFYCFLSPPCIVHHPKAFTNLT